jgi:hypothetical protein
MQSAPWPLSQALQTRILILATLSLLLFISPGRADDTVPRITATRTVEGPLIAPDLLPGDEGLSINGPSLIRMPAWVRHPGGRYHLYFAHHNGKYIRLAFADRPEGPWHLHSGGILPIAEQRALRGHIASPEAVIDDDTRQIFLFSHGVPRNGGPQVTTVAVSRDGITFTDLGTVVGPAYLRVFRHDGAWYGLNHSGVLGRARNLGEPFDPVATIIGPEIAAAVDPALRGEPGAPALAGRPTSGDDRYGLRHVGLDLYRDHLFVYFSCVGHRPERILCTVVKLAGPPETWRARGAIEVLRPERPWEGTDLPLAYSRGGSTIKRGRNRVHELRDPGVWREGDRAWLLYSIAGEAGLGIADLHVAFPEDAPTPTRR